MRGLIQQWNYIPAQIANVSDGLAPSRPSITAQFVSSNTQKNAATDHLGCGTLDSDHFRHFLFRTYTTPKAKLYVLGRSSPKTPMDHQRSLFELRRSDYARSKRAKVYQLVELRH